MKSAPKNKNFHIPLPDEIYSELRKAAEELDQPATQLARDVIQNWLKERKKQLLRKELAQYVTENAGTDQDHDPELEAAGIEHLLQKRKSRKE